MDLKKFYIEHALYPAMALLQKNRVMEYTKELQLSERQDPAQLAAEQRQRLTQLLVRELGLREEDVIWTQSHQSSE